MKVGIFGGTFDPIHNGHLAIATEVCRRLMLDEVWFVPAGQPWQKTKLQVTPWQQRVKMVELAIAGRKGFKLSAIEARPGPTYTIDTMLELQRQFGGKAELYFILGWDSLNNLPLWKEAQHLIEICRLVAVFRQGTVKPDITALEKEIPGIKDNVILLDQPQVPISSTDIRERVSRGQSIDDLVPPSVASYINQNVLYAG